MHGKLLTVEDLAERWGLSVNHTRELVESRPDLPALDFTAMRPGRKASRRTPEGARFGGRREYRFQMEAVTAWEAVQASTSPQVGHVPDLEVGAPVDRVRKQGATDTARMLQQRAAKFRLAADN